MSIGLPRLRRSQTEPDHKVVYDDLDGCTVILTFNDGYAAAITRTAIRREYRTTRHHIWGPTNGQQPSVYLDPDAAPKLTLLIGDCEYPLEPNRRCLDWAVRKTINRAVGIDDNARVIVQVSINTNRPDDTNQLFVPLT